MSDEKQALAKNEYIPSPKSNVAQQDSYFNGKPLPQGTLPSDSIYHNDGANQGTSNIYDDAPIDRNSSHNYQQAGSSTNAPGPQSRQAGPYAPGPSQPGAYQAPYGPNGQQQQQHQYSSTYGPYGDNQPPAYEPSQPPTSKPPQQQTVVVDGVQVSEH
ncbi:hypothetical protein GGI07_000831 [Coemansia sp. Benny D115]|nr:hypothetical protein GGI07_000831 [Coemansia sp. Benny D115]